MKKILLVFAANIALTFGFRAQAQEYVDLGLSVNWAAYNVGAQSIEELGTQYVAGTIVPLAEANDISLLAAKVPGSEVSGNSERDAATAKWGMGWRTPTRQEWDELLRCCKLKKGKFLLGNGVKVQGVQVTGPNGNTIFFQVKDLKNSFIWYYMVEAKMERWAMSGYIAVVGGYGMIPFPVYIRPVIDKTN